MSSTNRSNARKDHINDYYVTPINHIELFLKELKKVNPNIFTFKDYEKNMILDCCAGGDISHKMSYPEAIKNTYGYEISTIDIRADSLAEIKSDYLKMKLDYKPNIIITNPPFNKAIEFIEKALNDVADNGYVIILLRLNFFGSKARFNFFKNSMPLYCFVHHERMSFTDDKKTDSIEYCHMVFQKGLNGNYTELRVI